MKKKISIIIVLTLLLVNVVVFAVDTNFTPIIKPTPFVMEYICGGLGKCVDGPLSKSSFIYPTAIFNDENSNSIYVGDAFLIRKISNGQVETIFNFKNSSNLKNVLYNSIYNHARFGVEYDRIDPKYFQKYLDNPSLIEKTVKYSINNMRINSLFLTGNKLYVYFTIVEPVYSVSFYYDVKRRSYAMVDIVYEINLKTKEEKMVLSKGDNHYFDFAFFEEKPRLDDNGNIVTKYDDKLFVMRDDVKYINGVPYGYMYKPSTLFYPKFMKYNDRFLYIGKLLIDTQTNEVFDTDLNKVVMAKDILSKADFYTIGYNDKAGDYLVNNSIITYSIGAIKKVIPKSKYINNSTLSNNLSTFDIHGWIFSPNRYATGNILPVIDQKYGRVYNFLYDSDYGGIGIFRLDKDSMDTFFDLTRDDNPVLAVDGHLFPVFHEVVYWLNAPEGEIREVKGKKPVGGLRDVFVNKDESMYIIDFAGQIFKIYPKVKFGSQNKKLVVRSSNVDFIFRKMGTLGEISDYILQNNQPCIEVKELERMFGLTITTSKDGTVTIENPYVMESYSVKADIVKGSKHYVNYKKVEKAINETVTNKQYWMFSYDEYNNVLSIATVYVE